jgi:hypothetical protein
MDFGHLAGTGTLFSSVLITTLIASRTAFGRQPLRCEDHSASPFPPRHFAKASSRLHCSPSGVSVQLGSACIGGEFVSNCHSRAMARMVARRALSAPVTAGPQHHCEDRQSCNCADHRLDPPHQCPRTVPRLQIPQVPLIASPELPWCGSLLLAREVTGNEFGIPKDASKISR